MENEGGVLLFACIRADFRPSVGGDGLHGWRRINGDGLNGTTAVVVSLQCVFFGGCLLTGWTMNSSVVSVVVGCCLFACEWYVLFSRGCRDTSRLAALYRCRYAEEGMERLRE